MLDPSAAIARALATTSMPGPGLCLRFVDESYDTPSSRLRSGSGNPNAPADGSWLNAQDGWWYSTEQHPGDATDAPAGVPIYYSQMVGGDPAGHVALSLGDGWCRTTTGTRVITQTIAALNAERRSPNGGSSVLGWTSNYGNNPIAGITNTSQEDDMYDQTAQEGLYRKIETEARPFKVYGWGTGLIMIGPGGKQWNFPNMDYVTMCQSLGLCGDVIKSIPENERVFLVQTMAYLAPDPNTAAVDKIAALAPEAVAQIVKAIPQQVITLRPQDAQTIADLISSKIAGAATKQDVIDALKSITVSAG